MSFNLPDFPPGPLDVYRQRASFDWKKLKLCLDNESTLKLKYDIWKKMEKEPIFHRNHETPSLDEIRRLTVLRNSKIQDFQLENSDLVPQMELKIKEIMEAIFAYDPSTALHYVINIGFFGSTISNLGTAKHEVFIKLVNERKIYGAFALTEIAHGSNAKQLRTTATFDPSTRQFILNTPDFESAKCWIGNLGQKCTHAVVYAQLYMPDGKCHGLHVFIVPLRDPSTHLPLKGIKIYDLCEKIGLQGVDNGVLMMENVRIPVDYLLDRFSSIDENGEYSSMFPDERIRFAASLNFLLRGRLGTISGSVLMLSHALVIAIRYSAIRQQFGPSSSKEWAVIEYPLQQFRLLPWLATAYCLKICLNFHSNYRLGTPDLNNDFLSVLEFHGILSSLKPLSSWLAQESIQACREACGGHGFLKSAGIGWLRNHNDANLTFEGENNVLIQQTSNWLLNLWKNYKSNKSKSISPTGTTDFIYREPPNSFPSDDIDFTSEQGIPALLRIYEWLLHFLLKETTKKLSSLTNSGMDMFTAKAHAQQFLAKDLSLIFGEYETIRVVWQIISSGHFDKASARQVMVSICCLFALFRLDRLIPFLVQGEFIKEGKSVERIRESMVRLCQRLKDDAVALVDTLAPPDFILHSVIGASNGKVYENLENYLEEIPYSKVRPHWWKEILGKARSKL